MAIIVNASIIQKQQKGGVSELPQLWWADLPKRLAVTNVQNALSKIVWCSFKAFAQSRQLTDLMDEEEQAKTQEFLCQAKLQEAARKAAAGAEVKPEDQPDAKPSANGGGDAVAAVADGGEAIDAAMADGREAMDIDSNQEGARLEAPDQRANEDANPDSKNGENGSVVGSIEGGVKAEGGTQPANGTAVKKEDHREDPEVSDDEIKAYWLSGITALYQVKHQLLQKLDLLEW